MLQHACSQARYSMLAAMPDFLLMHSVESSGGRTSRSDITSEQTNYFWLARIVASQGFSRVGGGLGGRVGGGIVGSSAGVPTVGWQQARRSTQFLPPPPRSVGA